MSDVQERLIVYLEKVCASFEFASCIVATGDGFLLACAGEDMGEEFIAHLPQWLRLGQAIGETTTQGGMSCCCMVPENKTALLLAWKIEDSEHGELFFAAFTQKIPTKAVAILRKISTNVIALL